METTPHAEDRPPSPPGSPAPHPRHPPRRHAVAASALGPLRVVVDADGALAGVYLTEHDPAPSAATLGPVVVIGPGTGLGGGGGGSAGAEEGAGASGEVDPGLTAAVDAVLAVVEDPSCGVAVPLAQVPGTLLQHAVWREVSGIDAGRTRTYAQIAAAVGRPTAHRAVGAAVARNPRCLVVPCHRVVGSDGAVTGWAGGVELKRWLLAREQRGVPAPVTGAGPPPEALSVGDGSGGDAGSGGGSDVSSGGRGSAGRGGGGSGGPLRTG